MAPVAVRGDPSFCGPQRLKPRSFHRFCGTTGSRALPCYVVSFRFVMSRKSRFLQNRPEMGHAVGWFLVHFGKSLNR